MSVCPNKTHPDYIAAVKAYGEDQAIQMYIDNNYEIPSVLSNDTSIGNEFGRKTYKQKSTFALLRDNPKLAREIIDGLQKLYPEVLIKKDFIVDKQGKYVKIKEGEKGMHYRNAFESAVAWANDSYLETPPHEYAHHYIEMYKNTPLVKKALEQYGGIEELATMMGRYYTGQKMSTTFSNFVKNFWNKVRAFFGNPDVGFQLSEAFMVNEQLSDTIEGGLATVNYQKEGVRVRYDNGYDTTGLKKTSMTLPTIAESSEIYIKSVLASGFITPATWMDFSFAVRNDINQFENDHTVDSGGSKVYDGTINSTYLNDLREHLQNKDSTIALINAVKNKTELPEATTPDGKVKYTELMGQMQNANLYAEKRRNSLIMQDGSHVSKDDMVELVDKEVSTTQVKRNKLYDKIKWKPLRDLLKKVEKVMQYQTNSRLDAKYLSGSEESWLSKISYEALHNAENMRNKLIIDFNNALMEDTFAKEYKNWSYFKNKNNTINELSTKTYKFKEKGSLKETKVTLTRAEMLSVYLMARQERARNPIMKHGIILNDQIDGRNIPVNQVFEPGIKNLNAIMDEVIADPELMKVVNNIDSAIEGMSKNVMSTFLKSNGIALRKEENYFPVYSGSLSFELRKGKSSINDWKSLHTALGENNPIRIIDPIQVVNTYRNNAASYSTLALPIENLRKVIKDIESKYRGTQEQIYIEALKGIANRLEDSSLLYSNQSEEEFSNFLNKITSNFAVAVLGMNVPVMLKQSISFITAMEEISSEYLTKAGMGTKFFPMINPKAVFEALSYTGVKGGVTKLPVEWNLDTTKGVFADMKRLSPMLAVRLEGMVSRELGEAMMNQDHNEDLITLPWKKKDGSKMQISKSRLMEGIRIFDAVTIANLWKAAEYEAQGKYGISKSDPRFEQHVAIRVEEIVARTQPDWNMTNRSTASLSQNPVLKFFTMFSSATSKIAMLQLDGVLDFLNNPSQENKMKLIKRSANIMVTTAMTVAVMDMLKGMLLYGWDDDDELFKEAGLKTAVNSLSYFYGVGQLARLVGSQLDDKPFFNNLQNPLEIVTQDVAGGIANLAKGNVLEAGKKGLEVTFKMTGLPIFPLITGRQIAKRTIGE